MKRPPMIVSLQFRSHDEDECSRGVSLWIPLFIIVPIALIIVLAILLLLLPVFMVYVLVTWDVRWWPYLRHGVPLFIETMHALLGLKVDVEDQKQKIYIDVQ